MLIYKIIFTICFGLAVINLIVYPLFIFLINILLNKKPIKLKSEYFPVVSVLLSAYNEEQVIERRLENLAEQDYPENRLEIIVSDDGSSDSTLEIIERIAKEDVRIKIISSKERLGKAERLNRAVKEARGEILIFTDANTVYEKDTVMHLVHPFASESVGAAGGDLIYRDINDSSSSAKGEGLYWKYETFIKKQESKFYSMVMGAGAVYAIRKRLFVEVPPDLADDSYLPMNIIKEGYRMIFVEKSKAYEKPADRLQEEIRRRIRMVPQDVRGYIKLRGTFSRKNIRGALMLFFHKFLRWNLGMILLLSYITSAILKNTGLCYYYIFVLFNLFIILSAAGFVGWLTDVKILKKNIFNAPFYFTIAVSTAAAGYILGLTGRSSAVWNSAESTRTE